MDLCDLPNPYFSTAIDEATRYATVDILSQKSKAAWSVARLIAFYETQTDLKVQRVRTVRGGEYMCGALKRWHDERGIQHEPTAGYSPEADGLAERHNLTLLDKALPMLFGSGLPEHGPEPLSATQHASDAIIYANDLHNALPAKGAQLGRTPDHGFWGRDLTLSAFHEFGSRVYVDVPGKPFTHRNKYAPKGTPGRFLGFARPIDSGIYRVKFDSRREVQSQTVVFDGAPCPPPPILQPAHAEQHNVAAMLQADSDSESDTGVLQALWEQHEGGQQVGQPPLELGGEAAQEPEHQPDQPMQQHPVGGPRRSGRTRKVPEMFNPEPMTRREQAADQQARAQTASWGQGPGLKQQQAGLEGVAQQLGGHGRMVDEDPADKKRASHSHCIRWRRKRTTAKQKDSGRFQVVNPLEELRAVKQRGDVVPSSLVFSVQAQLAKTDAAEPRGRKVEGCVQSSLVEPVLVQLMVSTGSLAKPVEIGKGKRASPLLEPVPRYHGLFQPVFAERGLSEGKNGSL
jgi:hypothetical protein